MLFRALARRGRLIFGLYTPLRFLACYAAAPINTDRNVASDSHSAHDARLITIIINGDMQRGAIVPNRHVAGCPSPNGSRRRRALCPRRRSAMGSGRGPA